MISIGQGSEMESLLCEHTKRKRSGKMQGMAGMRRISEERNHKKKMGTRQMRKSRGWEGWERGP